MQKDWTDQELGRIADTAWAEILRFCKPDSCVLATRIFVDVLDRLGDRDVEGVCARVVVLPPMVAKHAEQHGCGWDVVNCRDFQEGEAQRFTRLQPPIAVLGHNPDAPARGPKEAWNGHLLAVVQRRWIVDLTISQISRPERGLTVNGTLVLDVQGRPNAQALLDGIGAAQLEDDQGNVYLYQLQPGIDGAGWRHSPDWAWQSDFRRDIGQATLDRLEGREPHYSNATLRAHAILGRI